jgi:hypothetical protein
MQTADPGRRHRRGLAALLSVVPGLAEVLGPGDPGTQRPEGHSPPEGEGPAPGGETSTDPQEGPRERPKQCTFSAVRERDETCPGDGKSRPVLIVGNL